MNQLLHICNFDSIWNNKNEFHPLTRVDSSMWSYVFLKNPENFSVLIVCRDKRSPDFPKFLVQASRIKTAGIISWPVIRLRFLLPRILQANSALLPIISTGKILFSRHVLRTEEGTVWRAVGLENRCMCLSSTYPHGVFALLTVMWNKK